MNASIIKLVIPAFMLSALVVAALGTSTVALQQSDNSGSYRAGVIDSSVVGGSGKPEGVTAPREGTSLSPMQEQCYVSCGTARSGILNSLCRLACVYVSDPMPRLT